MIRLVDIALCFLQIALMSFGGGIAVWARRQIVTKNKWINDDEFLSLYGLAQLLPGSNIVNLAMSVGARLKGVSGAAAAVAGVTIVPAALAVVLGALYFHYQDISEVQKLLRGMAAGSVAMMIAMGIQMAEHVWHKPSVLVFAALTFGAVVVAKLSLIFVVLVMSPFAIFWFWRGRVQ